jgi:hypothetical protein
MVDHSCLVVFNRGLFFRRSFWIVFFSKPYHGVLPMYSNSYGFPLCFFPDVFVKDEVVMSCAFFP